MTTYTTRTINNDSKAFGISLMLHGLLFAGLLTFGGMAVEKVKPVIVDLSTFSGPDIGGTLAGGTPQHATVAEQRPVAERQVHEKAIDKSANENINPVKTATAVATTASSPVALPSSAVKTVSAGQVQNGKSSGSVTEVSSFGNNSATTGIGASGASQQAQNTTGNISVTFRD